MYLVFPRYFLTLFEACVVFLSLAAVFYTERLLVRLRSTPKSLADPLMLKLSLALCNWLLNLSAKAAEPTEQADLVEITEPLLHSS